MYGLQRIAASGSSTSTALVAKTRVIYHKTIEKWITGNNDINTSIWLKFEADGLHHVLHLKCFICSQFKDKLVEMWNYRAAFVDGTTNERLSTVKDHAAARSRNAAAERKSGSHVMEYSLIAAALHRSMMDPTVLETSKKLKLLTPLLKKTWLFLKWNRFAVLKRSTEWS